MPISIDDYVEFFDEWWYSWGKSQIKLFKSNEQMKMYLNFIKFLIFSDLFFVILQIPFYLQNSSSIVQMSKSYHNHQANNRIISN